MAGISGINSPYSGLSLTELLSDVQKENSILDTSATAANAKALLNQGQTTARRAGSAYSISASSSVGQAALKKALAEMGGSGKVTFQDIAAYRKQLESEFSTDLRVELYEKGISLDTEFALKMDANGQIQVLCDDPAAKTAIQKHLSDNPETCEQFGYIQALSNLERAKQGPTGASAAMGAFNQNKKEIQLQAVEAFFDEALSSGMGYSALMASFSPVASGEEAGSASFYAGIDYTI